MKINILGRIWNFKRVRPSDLKGYEGHCDHPDTPNRTIKIPNNVCGKNRLIVTLHELRHSEMFELASEEYVDKVTKDLGEALWKLGLRYPEELTKKELEKLLKGFNNEV